MLFALLSLSFSYSLTTATDRVINTHKIDAKTLKSTESSWYYVYFQNFIGYSALRDIGIDIHPEDMIQKNFYRLYLSPENLMRLSSDVEITELAANQKLIESNIVPFNEATKFCVTAHDSYDKYDLPDMNFSNIYRGHFVVDVHDTRKAVKILSSINSVADILPCTMITKVCNRFAAGRLQGNFKGPEYVNGRYYVTRPLDKHGIDGTGQVIHSVDIGIDYNHTFFYDKNIKLVPNVYNPNHRKIVYYYNNEGNFKDDSGHGSHTAGTAAGKALFTSNGVSNYNGVAYNAKLSIFDANDGTIGTAIKVPELNNLNAAVSISKPNIQYLEIAYPGIEKFYDNEFDTFDWNHPDILDVGAAGNYGGNETYTKPYSIGSPCTSKNLVCVASSVSPYSSFESFQTYEISGFGNTTIAATVTLSTVPTRIWNSTSMTGEVVQLNDKNEGYGKKILIFPKMGLLDVGKKFNVINNLPYDQQPAAILYTGNSPPVVMSLDKDSTIPVFFTSSFRPKNTVNISLILTKPLSEKVSSFSGQGPGTNGIMKPDVIAPGEAVTSSVRSRYGTLNHFVLDTYQGTSMSTPNVAGTAALLRHYLVKYKKLKTVKGFLLKALIIASCDPLPGIKKRRPNSNSGHGMPNLENVCEFPDSDFKLLFTQDKSIPLSEDHKATLDVQKNGKPIRIAVSYLDKPGAGYESMYPFQRNINLYVISPSGKVTYGNQYDNKASEYYSTTEKIVIEASDVEQGKYEIHIVSSGNDEYSIDYAVIAVAKTTQSSLTFVKGSIKECSDGYVGVRCQIKEERIREAGTRNFNIQANEILYFRVDLPKNYVSTSITISPSSPKSFKHEYLFWDINEAFSIPSLAGSSKKINTTTTLSFDTDTSRKGGTIHFYFHNNYHDKREISIKNVLSVTGSKPDFPPIPPDQENTPIPVKPTPTPKPIKPTSKPIKPTSKPIKPTPKPIKPTSKPIKPTSKPIKPTLVPDKTIASIFEPVHISSSNNVNNAEANNNQHSKAPLKAGIIAAIVICVIAVVVILIGVVVYVYKIRAKYDEENDSAVELDI